MQRQRPDRARRLRARPGHLSPRAKSAAAKKSGVLAEDAVADFVSLRGFRVLGRNVRLGRLELDLVARKDDLVAIVEVRTRGPRSFERPLTSVSRTKRERLLRAAERLWREQLREMAGVERVRIDVAAVSFVGSEVRVEYIEGAVTAE